MSWEQIAGACRKGKPPEGFTTTSLEEAIEMAKNMKEHWREYYGV